MSTERDTPPRVSDQEAWQLTSEVRDGQRGGGTLTLFPFEAVQNAMRELLDSRAEVAALKRQCALADAELEAGTQAVIALRARLEAAERELRELARVGDTLSPQEDEPNDWCAPPAAMPPEWDPAQYERALELLEELVEVADTMRPEATPEGNIDRDTQRRIISQSRALLRVARPAGGADATPEQEQQ